MAQKQVSSFFYFLKHVYNAYKGIKLYYDSDGNIVRYSQESYETFDRFLNYIERCDFSHKKADKFLCRNWMTPKNQLVELWQQEFGKVKNPDTFRSQLSTLSRELYGLFGEDWAGDFMEDNATDVKRRLDLFENQATDFNILAFDDVRKSIRSTVNTYEIKDLSDEIAFIRKYNKAQYSEEMKQLDLDKMAYIRSILDEPLCLNGKYNTKKAEILNELEQERVKPLSCGIEQVLSQKQIETFTKVIKQNEDKTSSKGRYNELKSFIYHAMTIEGLNDYLSQFSTEDIKKAFNEVNNNKA